MKRILFLGNTLTAATAANLIRQQDSESSIAILPTDGDLPFRRSRLLDYMAKQCEEKDLFVYEKSFYEQNRIQLLEGKKCAKISFKRKYVTTEEKEQIEFDTLIVTDVPQIHLPEIKGNNKTGVYSFYRLQDMKKINQEFSIIETLAIEGNDFNSIKLALICRKRKKETILITRHRHLLAGQIDRSCAEMIQKKLEEVGIRIISNNPIQEILGDSDAKAIRLESGKVIALQALILASIKPDLRIFQGSEMTMTDYLVVDKYFRTSLDEFFATDLTACLQSDQRPLLSSVTEDGEGFGAIIAANMAQTPSAYKRPLNEQSLSVADLNLTLYGDTQGAAGMKIYSEIEFDLKQYKYVFIRDNKVCGVVLANYPDQKDYYARLVTQGSDVSSLKSKILECDYPEQESTDQSKEESFIQALPSDAGQLPEMS